MARLRTIKPEFWVSEQIGDCSTNARLTFIGMWNFCDDRGVHPAKPKTLKAELFPMDSFSADEIAQWVQELIAAGLVGEFEHGGVTYWYVTGWAKHQKIDRPSFKHPAPPVAKVDNGASNSPSRPRPLGEDSSSTLRAPPPGVEWSGVEGSRGESEGTNAAGAATSSPAATKRPEIPCPYKEIVGLYHDALPTLPGVKLMNEKRKAAMRKRWVWVLTSKKSDGTRRATTATQGLEWFRRFFETAADNDFVMGRTGRGKGHEGWRADLDYLLTDKGLTQVVERTEVAA